MATAEFPRRECWKHDLAPYLEVDAGRSLGQIASVVLPYLGVWALASIVRPHVWLAIGLGVLATVSLVRMYSFFHDLTHNSMFKSRAANSAGATCSACSCSRPTAGGSASTASITRTPATSTSAGRARSTR